jgi:hypothetical protein
MEELDDESLAAALQQACDAISPDDVGLVSVSSDLRRQADGDDDPLRGLIAGLDYHLIVQEERRHGAGPFGPMFEGSGGTYPPPLGAVDEIVPGTYELWERAIAHSPTPAVRARFADLLWVARYGQRPHEFAQVAVDSYVEAAAGVFGHPVERMEYVLRAVEIASQINDGDRRASAVRSGVMLVEAALEGEDRMPGVVLPILDLFVGDRPDRRPDHLGALIEAAIERYGDDPWNLQSALDLQARLLPLTERTPLFEREVRAFVDLAERSQGLVKYAHLQHAIELAEGHGLNGLADEVRRIVEGLTPDDLDLKEISAEVQIPREQIDEYIDYFVGDDDLSTALARFGSHIPSGEPEANRSYVAQLMRDHPLQFLVTRMTIGPENALVRSTGQDDAAEAALIDHEAQRISMFSLFAVDILDRLRERYGTGGADPALFETELIEAPVAGKIARAISLYEEGDFDSASCVLAPRLERIVRHLASASGLTVTRSPDRSGRGGGVKGLGEILGSLETVLEESARRYLKVLLSEITGLNLRNRVGHGLDDEIAQREAAMLIHAACHLRLYRRVPAGES